MLRLAILFIIATYIALLIQTALPLWLPFHELIPNLVIILTVDLGLRHHNVLGAILAFGIGYATDALSGTHLGMNAFLSTLIFVLIYQISSRLLVTNALVGAIMVFFAVMVAGLGTVAITSGRGAIEAARLILPHLALQSLVSALFAPVVFGLLARSKRMMGLPATPERE